MSSVVAPVPVGAQPRPALVGRRTAIGLVAAMAAVVCAAVLLFWWLTPVTRETGGHGAALVQIGRSTGMLSAILILVEVTLMARVPWLEHRIGADWLSAVHGWLGGYIIWLIATHVVTITVGDAMVVHTGVVHEASVLVLTYPDVLAGTVALALIAMVAMTSMRAVRRRLRYETWHFLHLYVYLAIGLAFAHQFATGAVFMNNRSARVVWVAAHMAVALLVLRYRVAAPLWLFARHRFRVTDVVKEPDGSTSVYVSGRRMEQLRVRPGQFFRWRFLARGAWWQAHPFSLSHAANGQWLRMTAKPLGDHSAWLAGLRTGMPVLLEGPYGAVTDRLSRRPEMLLVGGGSGVAPLLALAEQAVRDPDRTVTLLYRISRAEDINFRAELERLETTGRFRLEVVEGPRGDSDAADPLGVALPRCLPDPRNCDVFVCGPEGMTQLAVRGLRRIGVPARRIHVEAFALA